MKAPGKSHRKGIRFVKLLKMFPDDDAAQTWFEAHIWPNGAHCPHCGSFNVLHPTTHKSMTHRCRDCTATTSLKGVSSMKLHRDLEITQKSAWHLAHRIRKALEAGQPLFNGPVEADETYMVGREKNKHKGKKLNAGRGAVGKTAVVGVKDRASNRVTAQVVEDARAATLQGFVEQHTADDATVYTDDASAYLGLKRDHESVKHSVGEYVRDMAHTNGVESFWSMLKRAHNGTFHKMSPKHLNRYVTEFSGRHNVRPQDTADQMSGMARGMRGKRLRYKNLIADDGLDSGARS